jgi:hypothetical protein
MGAEEITNPSSSFSAASNKSWNNDKVLTIVKGGATLTFVSVLLYRQENSYV